MRTPLKASSHEEIQRAAENVYVYGYPLVLMDIVKRRQTAIPEPSVNRAPINQFAHSRFAAAPNELNAIHPYPDRLRSSAWLDLGKGPVVVSVPEIDRYYLFSLWSGWYEIFETIGSRRNGSDAGDFAIVGPRWSGKLPPPLRPLISPTDIVWIDGGISLGAAEDIGAVHALQDGIRLTPLSIWENPSMPRSAPYLLAAELAVTPQEELALFDARTYFNRLARLLERNPPQPWDVEIVTELSQIGFNPDRNFSFERLPTATAHTMGRAIQAAHSRIAAGGGEKVFGTSTTNWRLHVHPGRYQTNYFERAVAARWSIDGSLPEDVMCFHAQHDRDGAPLKGTRQYTVTFPPHGTPSTNAFWSLSLFDSNQRLVPNPIYRYVIHDYDRLKLNPDDSLSLHISNEWPGAVRDSNWLPAPKDLFSLALRIYRPRTDVVAGKWQPPPVIRT